MNELRETIVNIFAEVLLSPVDELDTSHELAGLGIDSILAAQLSKILSKAVGIKISPVELFECITIDNLISYLSEKDIQLSASTSEEVAVAAKPVKEEDRIVIVGMACRFPQSENVEAYWENLLAANNCITKTDRWGQAETERATGGFLEDISLFDSSFFRISPNEARCMDPQQRILLEVVQHAIEDANVSIETLREQSCGVFMTGLPGDYKFEMAKQADKVFSTHSFLGNAFSALAGRVAYFYDLKGPAINLDTACSSSLTAIHQACMNIQGNSCKAAIVGGVSVFSTTEMFDFSKQSNMASAQGKCAVFDNNADGFVPSEGAASIVLMSESEARRLNLRIYASIEGIECNHDGQSNGLMAPNSQSQARLIEQTYEKHDLAINELAYVEAHGTGTKLGDPIEMQGLTQAFAHLDEDYKCYLGASKAVIGHTLVCSGLASVIKMVLSFQHRVIPPLPAIKTRNEHIDFKNFELNTSPIPWPTGKPLAAVSAFGFTGSNSHLILKGYDAEVSNESAPTNGPFLFCVSAHSRKSLKLKIEQYLNFAKTLADEDLSILSEQLSFSRENFDLRLAVIAETKEEFISGLQQLLENVTNTDAAKVIELQSINSLGMKKSAQLFEWLNKAKISAEYTAFSKTPLTLPAYPFDRQSYWITEKTKAVNLQKEQVADSQKSAILQQLKESISDLLGYAPEQIETDKPLQSYGIDSLSAIKLLTSFKKIASELKPQDLFDFESLDVLADEIVKLGGADEIEAATSTAAPKEDRIASPQPASVPRSNFQASTPSAVQSNKSMISEYQLTELEIAGPSSLKWLATSTGNRSIVLLPPLNTSYLGWAQQLRLMARVGYRIYIPVYPGHMNNEFIAEQFNLETIVNDIYHFVKEELAEEAVPMLGWSLGGCICMQMATRYPEIIESMALISAASKFDQDIFDKTIALHAELEAHQDYLEVVLGNDEPIVQKIGAGAKLSVLKHYYDFLESFDLSQQLAMVDVPTLIVAGEKDSVITQKDIDILRQIPRHDSMILKGHGHFIPLTAARVFNKRIAEFVVMNERVGSIY